MSGIAAVYYLDGHPADRVLISAMLDTVAYRGPDGLNSWTDGPVALGHAMLRTTPESIGEHQPLIDDRVGLAITFDGRIDNRDELRETLKSHDCPLIGNTDAEFVLRSYQCWGEESPARILGDFAFALWDGRARRLFCARDFASVQPLYYFAGETMFICASEPQQILLEPTVSRVPDLTTIGLYMTGMLIDPTTTLYRNLRKLEGGCSLAVTPGKISRRRYFDIDPEKQIRYRTDAEYAEHFQTLMKEAVRCRLRTIDGVAAELSGGLDSSLVVGTIELIGPPKPKWGTFSLGFDHPDADERCYIRDVEAKWRLKTAWSPPFYAESSDYLADIRHYRHLATRPNTNMDTLMHHAMRDAGYRVVMTGQGGDQWFGGSPDCFTDLLMELKFAELFRLIAEESAHPTRVRAGHSPLGLLMRRTLWPLIPWRPKFLINRLRGIRLVPSFVNPDFSRRFDLERVRNTPSRPVPGLSYSQRTMFEVLNLGISIHFAELNERECAFAGLEGRHPFYDRRIIEFAFAIPEDQRCRPNLTKCIFREPSLGWLPESVRQRKGKAQFDSVLVDGLKKVTSSLGGETAFDSFTLVQRGWILADELRKVYRERIDDRNVNRWPLWSVMELEMWSRECLNNA